MAQGPMAQMFLLNISCRTHLNSLVCLGRQPKWQIKCSVDFHMEYDRVHAGPIDTEDLARSNYSAISNIRAMGPDLWAVEEFERSLLAGNDYPPSDAVPADSSKS